MKKRSSSLFTHPSYRYSQLQKGQTVFEVHHSGIPDLLKTIKEINRDILEITMKIERTFPALSKFIDEMFSTASDSGPLQINIQNLSEYFRGLEAILNQSATHHIQER